MPVDYATSPDYVDNRRLREAFTAGGITSCSLAKALGITRTAHTSRRLKSGEVKRYRYRVGDGSAVKRDLGLMPQQPGHGRGAGGMRRWINRAKALRYAEALGLDPADLGL